MEPIGVRWCVCILACVSLQTGCATIFSGTKQKVRIETAPPQAHVVVLGGAVGTLLASTPDTRKVTRKIIALFGSRLTAEQRQALELLDLRDLVAALAVWTKDQVMTGLPPAAEAAIRALPPKLVSKALAAAGVDASGQSPIVTKLRRDSRYAVLSWQAGHRPKLTVIDSNFNWVVLWNVLNAGLGVIVDVGTGAWRKLSPSELQIELPAGRPAGGRQIVDQLRNAAP